MSNDGKLIFGLFALLGSCVISVPTALYFSKKRESEANIRIAEIKATYPPEYWKAKEAEVNAEVDIKKAKIESDERLLIDKRKREENEIACRRNFERNAPAEYWEQKRVAEEERTKRELNRQRYKAEVETAKQHKQAIESGIRATERFGAELRRNQKYPNGRID